MTAARANAAEPPHVRAAPSHPDPYPYYGRLARDQRVFRDETNNCWVVAGADAVREVLENELCLTRPAIDPIPAATREGAMAEIFGRLVRLRDDEGARRMKTAVTAALRGLDLASVAALARGRAVELDAELSEGVDEAWITRFIFALPVQVIARLLGVSPTRYGELMQWLTDYGTASASAATGVPVPDATLLERGHDAARKLLGLIRNLITEAANEGPLLRALTEEARRAGCDDERDIVANVIGYLIQEYVATASLIGLTLLALARHPALLDQVQADRSQLRPLIQEVLRCDTITSSTIRFMARDGVIAGQPICEGEMIIVLIAAANRDPVLNNEPQRFDIARDDRKYLEFGAGRHACPADKFAPLIAEIGVDHLLTRGIALDRLVASVSYAASAHVRTPLFTA